MAVHLTDAEARRMFPRGLPDGTTIAPRPKAPRREKAESPKLAEPGTVIVEGVVMGRAVSWKSPNIGGGNVKRRLVYKTYRQWKELVAFTVRPMMHGVRPYPGPVMVEFTFYLTPNPGHTPDVDNLGKSTQDSLNRVVFIDDTQVCESHLRRVITSTEPERVEIRVTAM